jgi:Uma2 family endonuclease
MPEDFRAELIGGVVRVTPPADYPHGRCVLLLNGLLGTYEAATPGAEGAGRITLILGHESEPEPDLHLRFLPEYGGRSKENEEQYLTGPPELVIEVADGTEAVELWQKLADYRDGGVREYLVFCVRPGELRAFPFGDGKQPTVMKDGTYRSTEFPGLWIDVAALVAKDVRRVLATGRAGIASDEHSRFVDGLLKKVQVQRGTGSRLRT